MSGDSADNGRDACERCGKRAVSLVAGRISKLSVPGHVDFFRCAACGYFSHRDVPREPPKD